VRSYGQHGLGRNEKRYPNAEVSCACGLGK
jgi:hypothetical protein